MKRNKALPGYLLDKYKLVGSMTFTLMFALVFLNLYIPFSPTSWFKTNDPELFNYTVLFLFLSLMLLITSRVVMYKTKHLFKITVIQYILWSAAEVVLVCAIYTLFTMGLNLSSGRPAHIVFLHTLLFATVSIGIPYVLSAMYNTIMYKDRMIRMMNYANTTTDEAQKSVDDKFTIFDGSGSMRLSVKSENLFYIESDDNYVKVWYSDASGELQKYVLRCRMKSVEDSFRGTSLVRCHRKYIVNTSRVKVLRKEQDAYYLDMSDGNIPPIPVSKTYEKAILSKF